MKRKVCKKVICPFYKGEERQEIFCEGLVPDNNIHLGYANPGMLRVHRAAFCEVDWQKCPIATLHAAKYEDK